MQFTETKMKVAKTSDFSEREIARLQRAIGVLRGRYERWLTRRYAAMLRGLRDELRALGHVPDDAEVLEMEMRFDDRQTSILGQYYEQLYPLMVSFVLEDEVVKSKSARDVEFKGKLSLRISEWMKGLLATKVKRVSQDIFHGKDSIREAMQSSGGDVERFMTTLEKGSDDRGGLFSKDQISVRARRIAVTETGTAINDSMAKASEETSFGRKRIKVWVTTEQPNVRSSHREMHKVTVPAGEKFRVPICDSHGNPTGSYDYMDYACDPSASAGNRINCHCMTFYRYA